MARKLCPPIDLLKTLLTYDAETGGFTWLKRPLETFPAPRHGRMWNARFAGKPALNTKHHAGYLYGELSGQPYLAHRLAWYFVHNEVPDEVDHINGVRDDNRICNLRTVNRKVNCRNAAMSRKNTSGMTGVVWDKLNSKWTVRLGHKFLGRYSSFNEAVTVRKMAEIKDKYHPNHGRDAIP